MRIPTVLHPVVQPISVTEFAEAVHAICKPKPSAIHPSRTPVRRNIALAISGGVDSMALAWLFSSLRAHHTNFPIGSSPIEDIIGFVVDHQLRPNSADEAARVRHLVSDMGPYTRAVVAPVSWPTILGRSHDLVDRPHELPNLELWARRARFRTLARMCIAKRTPRLWLAHHEDDVYETVLARLAFGHGSAGLRGIAPVADIPECADMYGASSGYRNRQSSTRGWARSGLAHSWDQVRSLRQTLSMQMDEHDARGMLSDVGVDVDAGVEADAGVGAIFDSVLMARADADDAGARADAEARADADEMANAEARAEAREVAKARAVVRSKARAEAWAKAKAKAESTATSSDTESTPHPTTSPFIPLTTESNGIQLYRPLLPFSKDRLMATCEAAGIQWFDDPTNADPSICTRNAIRHLVKHHALPAALQKPAILNIAQRISNSTEATHQQARRVIIARRAVKQFGPNTGIALVEFPTLHARLRRRRSRYNKARRQIMTAHLRNVTACIVSGMMALVSPLAETASLSSVLAILPRIYTTSPQPRAFVHGAVMFTPVMLGSGPAASPYNAASATALRWQLARAPFISPQRREPPSCSFRCLPRKALVNDARVLPAVLAATQDRTATATVTTTPAPPLLSALEMENISYEQCRFATENTHQLWDNRFWIRVWTNLAALFHVAPVTQEHLRYFRRALGHTESEDLRVLLSAHAPSKVQLTLPGLYVVLRPDKVEGQSEWQPEWLETTGDPTQDTMVLVSLPSLDIQLPGISTWLHYQIRYKQVNSDLIIHP